MDLEAINSKTDYYVSYFSQLVNSATSRQKYATSIVAYAQKYSFDLIEIGGFL